MYEKACRYSVALFIIAFGLQSPSQAQLVNWVPNFSPGSSATTDSGASAAWLGGDNASAVVLDASTGRTFWAFADTFIQPQGTTHRYDQSPNNYPNVVGNTIAVVTKQNGIFTPTYYFRGTGTNPKPFFEDPTNPSGNLLIGNRFWTQKTFLHAGKLFVFLIRVDSAGEYLGTLIARVNNPTATPYQWQYDLLTLTQFDTPIYGLEAFVFGDYLYMYGRFDVPDVVSDIIVARIPVSNITTAPANGSIASNIEHLTGQMNSATYEWTAGFLSANYRKAGFNASGGFSARFNPAVPPTGKWQVVYSEAPVNPPSHVVKIQVGDGPFGPWSAPVNLKLNGQDFVFNEFIPGSPIYHSEGDAIVYQLAEKEFFSSNPGNQVFFTYVNNQNKPPGQWTYLYTDLNYYRVWPVQLPNPFVP